MRYWSLLAVLLISTPILAVDYSLPYMQNGNSPSFFLSNQTFSESVLAVYENDAGGTWKNSRAVSMFRSSIYNGLDFFSIATAFGTQKRYIFAYSEFGKDGIPKTDIDSSSPDDSFIRVGSYGYKNSQAKLTYQYFMSDSVRLGAGLNLYQTTIDSVSDTGFNASFGLLSESEKFDIAIAIQNLLPTTMQLPGEEKLPMLTVINTKIKPRSWINITPRAIFLKSSVSRERNYLLSTGVQLFPLWFFSVEASIYEQFSGRKPTASHAIGTSVNISDFLNIHYAYRATDFSEAKDNHLVSVTFQF